MPTKKVLKKVADTTPASAWSAIATLLLSFVKSPLLRAILTALLAGVSGGVATIYSASSMVPTITLPKLPHILPLPRRAEDAIGRLRMGNAGCTGTIIGPVWSDDKVLDILTAAHCIKVGESGTMTLKDGRVLQVKCLTRDAVSDAAWLRATKPDGDVPYLLMATENPHDGEAVWHQGYGIDKPGNREVGISKGVTGNGKQCSFRLSVSPGDSGGSIVLDRYNRVISPVCCTTRLSAVGEVFGATPAASQAIRPHKAIETDEPALFYPIMPLPEWTFNQDHQS